MNKLSLLLRHLNHRYSYLTITSPTLLQSHSQYLLNLPNPKPYFFIPILPFSTTTTTSSTTTTTTTTRKPVAVYLIERLGFSEEESLAISKKLLRLRDYPRVNQVTDLISVEKSDIVITYLQDKNHCGLDLFHIKKVITKHPKILAANVDKTLRPKIQLLQDLGFSTSDLALVLSANPRLYLVHDLSPAIQALRGIMGTDDDVVGVFKKLNQGTAGNITKSLVNNVTMLENEYGIPREKIQTFLTSTPKALLCRTDWLRNVLVRIEEKWGISRDSTEFLRAVSIFYSNSDENFNSKCQVFRSYGWSDSDILSLIRRLPSCLGHSEAGMKKKLDFYMNELGYEPPFMVYQKTLFSFSLEKRVVPRHRILEILKKKGLVKSNYQLYNGLRLTDNQFLGRFILPFENVVPELRDVYINGGSPTEELMHFETFENERCTQVALE